MMNVFKSIPTLLIRTVAKIFVLATLTAPLWAQDTTTISTHHHPPYYNTQVRNAKVVYVEGNDLVLKLENGNVEHLVVPDSDRFTIDGKDVSVKDLKPGTTLTQTITTETTPRYVKTVRILQGKVWHVSKPNGVILTLPDGTNQAYTIPKHAKMTINGKQATGFDLKKGMTLQATIITDEPQTIVSHSKTVVGQAPPATPPMVGVLLIQPLRLSSVPTSVREPEPTPTTVASAEEPAAVLPKTGSALPLFGLLGVLAIGTSVGLGVLRRRFTV